MQEVYQEIMTKIKEADAILIGASNGLSISEGFNIFADDAWFQENFGDFRKKYGIQSVLRGIFFQFPTEEEKWAFWSRLAYLKCYAEQPSQMMKNLYGLVKDKTHFVVTSNGEDHFTLAGFAPEHVFEMEGKYTENICASGCHDEVYPNREEIIRMAQAEQDGLIPTELLPKCPKCGGNMQVHIAFDRSFFHHKSWQQKQQAYEAFIQKYHKQKLVILELGIGWRNQMIKAPFMQIAASGSNATYVTFNKGELYIPQEIAHKSIGVDGDIAIALEGILRSTGQ